jgi:anti-sigma B factor antagonist
MTIQNDIVVVEQLPEISTMKQAHAFIREIKGCMSIDRPRIVLDCSQLRQMNPGLAYVLLCWLEETIKRSGDLKLAAMPSSGRAMLKHIGVSRVFEIYDTAPDAVNSFCQIGVASPVLPQAVTVRSLYEVDNSSNALGWSHPAVGKTAGESGATNGNIGILATATDRS